MSAPAASAASPAPAPAAPPASTVAEEQDHLLLLAETIGEIRERLQKVETEFTAQAAPIDAAGRVLEAALAGIKTLQSHILAQDIAQLAGKLDTARTDLAAKVDAEGQARATALTTLRDEVLGQLTTLGAQLTSERTRLASLRRDDRLDLAECHGRLQALDSGFSTVTEQLAALRERLAVAPTAFNPRGDWSDREAYARLDVVTLVGSSWVSLVDNNKEKPKRGSKAWSLLAARGGSGGGANVVAAQATLVTAPAANNSSGTAGQIAYGGGYFYLCVATNTWRRAALTTF